MCIVVINIREARAQVTVQFKPCPLQSILDMAGKVSWVLCGEHEIGHDAMT